jgi:hypothetical protein
VKQHSSGDLRDVSDGSFSNAVLEMGVDAAVTYCLLMLLAVLLECVVGESAVVCMIVLDGNAMVCCESLERLLSFDGLLRRHACHEMNVTQSRVVIDEDGGCGVPLGSEAAFELGYEAHLR